MFRNYRRYRRYSVLARAMIVRRDDGSPGKLPAQINTISQGGLGFYTGVLLEKSTPVFVELLDSVFGGIGVFEGRIASVCPVGDNYFTGVAFDTDISYERFVEIIS